MEREVLALEYLFRSYCYPGQMATARAKFL
jgi:hypothetical protein